MAGYPYRHAASHGRMAGGDQKHHQDSRPPVLLFVSAAPAAPVWPGGARHFSSRTTKSGDGGANPAVTAYNESPNSAIVVGTLVSGFDAKGSVM